MATSTSTSHHPVWTWVAPALGVLLVCLHAWWPQMWGMVLWLSLVLIVCVVAAVHHAEIIALRVGEPMGSLVLALSVTTIEVGLIVSMMLGGGPQAMALPRDTIFAAVMLILNGIIGMSLLVGGWRHGEQQFNAEGMTDALCTTAVIVVLAMVLPNYLSSGERGVYAPQQLVFVAVATLALFAAFTRFQTVARRSYFVQSQGPSATQGTRLQQQAHAQPSNRTVAISLLCLLAALVVVVLSAKGISPYLGRGLASVGAPAAVLGIVIAAIVLLPEFGAAIRAARQNRLQASLNLAMGSVIASIGLTVPVVALLAVYMGWPLELGLDPTSLVLLLLSLFVAALSLRTGQTTSQPGVVHLVMLAAYLFFSLVP